MRTVLQYLLCRRLDWVQLHNNFPWPWLSRTLSQSFSHTQKLHFQCNLHMSTKGHLFVLICIFFGPPPALLGLLTYAKTAPVCLLLHFYSLLRKIYGFVHIFHLFAFYDHASIDSVTITIRRAGSWPSYSTTPYAQHQHTLLGVVAYVRSAGVTFTLEISALKLT